MTTFGLENPDLHSNNRLNGTVSDSDCVVAIAEVDVQHGHDHEQRIGLQEIQRDEQHVMF